jgi:hypothetical protein
MLPSLITILRLESFYDGLAANLLLAVLRSVLCSIFVLVIATSLNRIGFRLKF